MGAVLLPFGWLLVLGRVAWAYAASRRGERRPEP
jgi:hypothetical protein